MLLSALQDRVRLVRLCFDLVFTFGVWCSRSTQAGVCLLLDIPPFPSTQSSHFNEHVFCNDKSPDSNFTKSWSAQASQPPPCVDRVLVRWQSIDRAEEPDHPRLHLEMDHRHKPNSVRPNLRLRFSSRAKIGRWLKFDTVASRIQRPRGLPGHGRQQPRAEAAANHTRHPEENWAADIFSGLISRNQLHARWLLTDAIAWLKALCTMTTDTTPFSCTASTRCSACCSWMRRTSAQPTMSTSLPSCSWRHSSSLRSRRSSA